MPRQQCALAIWCLAITTCLAAPVTAKQPPDLWKGSRWIWQPATLAAPDPGNAPIHLRRTFELKEKPASAEIHVTVDNKYELFVNGKSLGGDGNWNTAERYDIGKLLTRGRNAVALKATNQGGPAGAIVWMRINLPDAKRLTFGTDRKWRVSTKAPADWTKIAFDDSKWTAAQELGGPASGPWNLAGRSSGQPSRQVVNKKIATYRPAAEEAKQFLLPEGFEIELVAAEPLIINPVCIALDEQGRIYVSESHTYRYGPGRSPIKPFTNPVVRLDPLPGGNGFKRVLVAEGFDDPVMGMAIRDGQLWCAANNLLYRFDLGPDGRGTNKKMILIDKNKAWNPFGMFVLEWGPEGKLYLSVGNHNIDIRGPEGRITGRGNSGIVMRMNADGMQMERLVHGLRVPYSFEYDIFGQLWVLSNGQGNPNRFVRVIEGVDYHCYSRPRAGNEWLAGKHPLAPPCIEMPRGACTQLLRYHSSAFPKSYWGSLIINNWGAHGFGGANRALQRYVPDDRNHIAHKEDFLLCRDPHFRSSHVLISPDGSLLVADWYGRDDESDLTGRIWRIRYTGDGAPKLEHDLNSPRWTNEDYAVSALSSPNAAIRAKAADTLVNRGGLAIESLKHQAAACQQATGAAQALWALLRIGTPESKAAIAAGAKHNDWRVRRLAMHLHRRFDLPGKKELAATLEEAADPAVRIEAAASLGEPAAIRSALLDALAAGAAEDTHLRYAAAWQLARVADGDTFRRLLRSPSESMRRAGLIAIDVAAYEGHPSKQAALETLAAAIAEPGLLRFDLLLDLARLLADKSLIAALEKVVARPGLDPAVTARVILLLRETGGVAARRFSRTAQQRFLKAVEEGKVQINSPTAAMTLLEIFETEPPTSWVVSETTRRLLDRDAKVREQALMLLRKFGSRAANAAEWIWPRLLEPRHKLRTEDKLTLLAALDAVDSAGSTENWQQLLASSDAAVAQETVRMWRRFRDRPKLAAVLRSRVKQLADQHPDLAGDLAAVLAHLSNGKASQDDLSLPELPRDKDAIAAAAMKRLGSVAKKDRAGRRRLGQTVFSRAGCVKCHTTATADTPRAPSLKGIGKDQKHHYLLESLLHPSKVIKTGYLSEAVVTTDGEAHMGLVREEGENLRVLGADKEVVVPKSKVESRSVIKTSIMPEGQERQLSLSEIVDLVLYLESLR